MKRTVIIIALMAFVGIANGQAIRKVGGGVNFTSITGTGDDVSGNLGWQAGGSVQFGKKFYFEPGVFYMVENAEATVINNGVSTFSDSQFKGVKCFGKYRIFPWIKSFWGRVCIFPDRRI
jgi:hypothetical protein